MSQNMANLIFNTCRRAALRRWKNKNGPFATYEALLKIFVDAEENNSADVLCKLLVAGMDVYSVHDVCDRMSVCVYI